MRESRSNVLRATVFVTVKRAANQTPTARDDQAATVRNLAVDVQVLNNDTDPEDALDSGSLIVKSEAASGSVQLNGDGSIRYAPNADFVGIDTFTYEVCDLGQPAECDTATVRLEVLDESALNEAYALDDAAFVRAGELVRGNVLTNDLDPEGDGWQSPTVTAQPAHGMVDLAVDGSFTYTASLDFIGEDRWRYRVCDTGVGPACAEADVIVTVSQANQPPLARADVAHTQVDTSVSGATLHNDVDPEGDAMTVSEQPVIDPGHGTVVLTSAGLFTYQPAPGYAGPDYFVYRVCDAGGRCSEARVTIDVRNPTMANAAPYLGEDAAVTRAGQAVIIHVLANDGDLDGALDPTTMSIVQPADLGVATVNADGTITYRPPRVQRRRTL